MKLNELFTIQYGSNLELSNVEESDISQGIPFVSRTEKNCGVSAYIVQQPSNVKINPKHTLSVALGSSSVLETFYQEKEYYSGRDIAYLKPKFEMTKEEMIYYALCIRANKLKYSYGRQANRTLKDIELPDYHKIPKWINSYKSGNIEITKPINKDSIILQNFNDFNLCYLFDVVRGKSKPISDMNLNGNIPVISSTEFNNGISCFVDEIPTFVLTDSYCLTLAINGSVGSCFLQNNSFIATADVAILIPKEKTYLNKYTAIYLITLLTKEFKLKYSYGRKVSLENLKNTTIKLPTKDGEVDWESIEFYIKNIESKYKINEITINT